MIPAIAVPAWAGPPFRNVRTWSRLASGMTFVSVSHAGEATPCSQTPSTNRRTTSVTNPALTSRMPNDPTYSRGRTSIIVAMPNRAKRRLVTRTETRNAAPVIAAQNSPKNPARSPASGNRSVAAVAHGRYSEKNRTENSTAANVIHTSSRERRTYPNATVRSRHGDEVGRRALRTLGCASVPAADSTTRHSATEVARAAAQTRSRFSVPITRTSGSVSNPPTTDPRISPAANSGNRRFARRVSVTTPAVPQTNTFCSRTASATVSHSTGKIHRPSVRSARRSATTTPQSPAGIAR